MIRAEALRRVQIGLIGLLSVLLLVAVANMALDGASDEKPVTEEMPDAAPPIKETVTGPEAPKEPLAEIGLTPAPADEPAPDKAVPEVQ